MCNDESVSLHCSVCHFFHCLKLKQSRFICLIHRLLWWMFLQMSLSKERWIPRRHTASSCVKYVWRAEGKDVCALSGTYSAHARRLSLQDMWPRLRLFMWVYACRCATWWGVTLWAERAAPSRCRRGKALKPSPVLKRNLSQSLPLCSWPWKTFLWFERCKAALRCVWIWGAVSIIAPHFSPAAGWLSAISQADYMNSFAVIAGISFISFLGVRECRQESDVNRVRAEIRSSLKPRHWVSWECRLPSDLPL